MGNMVEQSWPVGQHIADWPPLKGVQVVVLPQQKFEGRPCPHTLKPVPHVIESLVKRPIAWAALTAMATAMVELTEVEMR